MRNFKRAFAPFVSGLILAGLLMFNACSEQSPIGFSDDSNDATGIALAKKSKQGKATFIGEGEVQPGVETKIKLDVNLDRRISVKIYAGNLSEPTEMRLESMGELSNTFRLHPMHQEMPAGCNIEMAFNKDLLPKGIDKDDLRILEVVDGDQHVLTDGFDVTDNDGFIQIKAKIYRTNEFFLGAYFKGILFRMEGEISRIAVKKFNRSKKEDLDLGGGSKFLVPEDGLSEDTEIFMAARMEVLDNGDVRKVFDFGPHGLVFSKPAKIIMSASEFGDQLVDLLYFNPDTQEWELSFEGELSDDGKKITVEVPHFSRYAVAWSN